MRRLSRRSAIAALPGAPALALPELPAVAGGAMLAAIAAHAELRRAYESVCELTDEAVAAQQGREIAAADRAIFEAADDAEWTAFEAVFATPIGTVSDLRALARWAGRLHSAGFSDSGEPVAALD